MKPIITLFSALFITACCFAPKGTPTSQGDEQSAFVFDTQNTDKEDSSLINPNDDNHFLQCRKSEAARREHVDAIIAEIENHHNGDVLLYFHGGLSSHSYVRKKLGQNLLNKVFSKADVDQKLYPVFINYDAGPLKAILEALFDKTVSDAKEGEKSTNPTTNLSALFAQKLAIQESFSEGGNTPFSDNDRITLAVELFNQELGQTAVIKDINDLSRKQRKILEELLESDTLPKAFEIKPEELALTEGNIIDNQNASFINQATRELYGITQPESLDGISPEQLLSTANLVKLSVLRIIARAILKIDHGFPATIQEEYLNYALRVPLRDVARKHWGNVKQHAEECFEEGSSGHYLITELLKLQQRKPFKINTLSHSAGSIPTAELVEVLDDKGLKNVIERIVMLVPAITQEKFAESMIENKDIYNNIDVYYLTEKAERDDVVGISFLYDASLLYAVSSMAETSFYMDKMLLIDQHMKSDRFPYYKKWHNCLTCENPKDIWDFFSENENAQKFTYPLGGNLSPDAGKKAPTHGGTKHPWVSPDLTRHYLKRLGVENTDGMRFTNP